MGLTRNIARCFGNPVWALLFVLMGIIAVVLGYTMGGSQGNKGAGGAKEPVLRVMDLRLDGFAQNTVLRLMITNGTSTDWEIPVRIPKTGAVPIPELHRLDPTGSGMSLSPLLHPAVQGTPVQRFRLRAGHSMPLEFSAPLDPSVKAVGVLADDSTSADRLRERVNHLLGKLGLRFRLNTRPTLHILHTAIPVNPIMPFLLN